MFKACIFDLDGTLCDSVESIAVSANQAVRELGLPEAPLEKYYYFVGDGVDMLIRRLLEYGGVDPELWFDRVKERYLEVFKEGCLYHVVPYEGIAETLAALKKAGAKLAVLSNKPHENTQNVIKLVFGDAYFDCILGHSDRFPRKPNPSSAIYLAKQFGVKPVECLYIGDTCTDMETGNGAGMYTVGVEWGFRGREELEKTGADTVVAKPAQLLDVYLGK